MKKLILLLPVLLLAISFAAADNGFCFKLNYNAKVVDSWSNNVVNGTAYITTKSAPGYCLTFNSKEFKINFENGELNFNQMVASPNSSCKFDIKIYSAGYLMYNGTINVNGNQSNYTTEIKMIPNLKILFARQDGKIISGFVYVNGEKIKIVNNTVEIPNTRDIVWIYTNISGYLPKNLFVNTNHTIISQDIVKVIEYLIPNPTIEISQNLSKTNVGEGFKVEINMQNPGKASAPIMINGNINGCGTEKSFNLNLSADSSKSISYILSPTQPGNCKVTLFYKVYSFGKLIKSDSKEISHFVSDKYNISYKISGNTIIASVYDVNGNPVDTNLSIVYNGTEIKFTKIGGKYYAKIPGNNFNIVASDGKNKGIIGISGNFIKTPEEKTKDHIVGWVIIGALSVITVGWIVYSRKLK